MAKNRVLCMCGMDLGYRMAEFLLGTDTETAFVINENETVGSWYRTPLELNAAFITEEQAADWKPDLLVTAYYHRLLPAEIFQPPPMGAWNIHLGDAERYRGAFPSIRAIANGDAAYSVTLHRIDSGIDTGDILGKLTFEIPDWYTGRELYVLMVEKGLELFKEHWQKLVSGEALELTRKQDGANAETMYRKDLSREVKPDRELIRKVRALTFPPFPPPYFTAGGRRFIIIEDPDGDTDGE